MATFGDMKTRIASELHRSDLSTYISNSILSAIAFYESNRFFKGEKRGTFSTIAGQRYYGTTTASPGTLPSDIVEIDSIVTTVNNRIYKLEQVSYEHLEDIDAGVTPLSGYPRLWAWYAEQIRFYPSPNNEYLMTVSYQYERPVLSADSDENFWTTEAEELIRNRAKKDICMSVLTDPDRAQLCASMEAAALKSLKAQTVKLLSSNQLTPTAF